MTYCYLKRIGLPLRILPQFIPCVQELSFIALIIQVVSVSNVHVHASKECSSQFALVFCHISMDCLRVNRVN